MQYVILAIDEIESKALNNKSNETKALYLFLNGKRPIDVAIELNLSPDDVEYYQQEFWLLNGMDDLASSFVGCAGSSKIPPTLARYLSEPLASVGLKYCSSHRESYPCKYDISCKSYVIQDYWKNFMDANYGYLKLFLNAVRNNSTLISNCCHSKYNWIR